jgi:hypothetical protein
MKKNSKAINLLLLMRCKNRHGLHCLATLCSIRLWPVDEGGHEVGELLAILLFMGE